MDHELLSDILHVSFNDDISINFCFIMNHHRSVMSLQRIVGAWTQSPLPRSQTHYRSDWSA